MYLCIYMQASLTRERKREFPGGGQLNCLEECCYSFLRSNNIISYKQILTFRVVKNHDFVLQTLASKMLQPKTTTIF